jgi:carbonic anhydrase
MEVAMSVSRRDFMRLAALTGSASLLGFSTARAASETDALLLSCMDYRLTQATERYMASRGLGKKYDHIVLAGAALGALTPKFPAWNQTFWEHLSVAIDLHAIHKVVLLNHRDCGAFKVILGEDFAKDRAKETAAHATQLRELRRQILAKHPTLTVGMYLMSLDGKTETIAAE